VLLLLLLSSLSIDIIDMKIPEIYKVEDETNKWKILTNDSLRMTIHSQRREEEEEEKKKPPEEDEKRWRTLKLEKDCLHRHPQCLVVLVREATIVCFFHFFSYSYFFFYICNERRRKKDEEEEEEEEEEERSSRSNQVVVIVTHHYTYDSDYTIEVQIFKN
jgi:hypothetical protein